MIKAHSVRPSLAVNIEVTLSIEVGALSKEVREPSITWYDLIINHHLFIYLFMGWVGVKALGVASHACAVKGADGGLGHQIKAI